MKRLTMVGVYLTVVLGLSIVGGPVWATNMMEPLNTCTITNCSSRPVDGSVTQFGPTAQPWVGEFFAGAGECLRLDVLSQGADLEMVVVAPNGTVFRNDDKGVGCVLCSLVKVGSTPNNGWYTVRLSHFAGTAVGANFSMQYGRYNSGNPNCASPTPGLTPASSEPELDKPDDDVVESPRPGRPGAD